MRFTLRPLLITAGAVLTFLGAREFLESRLGQSSAARDFATPVRTSSTLPAPNRVLLPKKTGDVIAKLTIPRLNSELYVFEGDSARQLRRGPGHLPGSVMPGGSGNCVIAGHRDTHFRVLQEVRKGDEIFLETEAGKYLYRVKNTRVVSPDNTSALQPAGDSVLNLITCYPFHYVGPAPKRFVVEASLANHGT